jgi:hypothetical protein
MNFYDRSQKQVIFLCCRYASESGEQTVLENMKEYLVSTIQRTFEVGVEQAECLYSELLQCTRKKNLVSSQGAGIALH